jgi:hypothetical protein
MTSRLIRKPRIQQNRKPLRPTGFRLSSVAVFRNFGRAGCDPFYRSGASDLPVSQLDAQLEGPSTNK